MRKRVTVLLVGPNEIKIAMENVVDHAQRFTELAASPRKLLPSSMKTQAKAFNTQLDELRTAVSEFMGLAKRVPS
ncbi:MAG: hypothetical protein ACYDED_10385 [Ferrimicrobium sp.]